ncbi:hypothetical protein HGM15179_005969 [Zosterops borbonicus]|uniref:Uncharacterized protein n=1 Tax=Zosterops borbonicus TaxID=364589 RepID=A0A8K1LPK1_9PASS|nr:hypothetical protein HGM15179_005969 [Zosterops borbonicus]
MGREETHKAQERELQTPAYGKNQLHSPIRAEAGKQLGEGPRGPGGHQIEHEAAEKTRCILCVASKAEDCDSAPVKPHLEYGIWGELIKEKDGLAGVGPVRDHEDDQRTGVSFMQREPERPGIVPPGKEKVWGNLISVHKYLTGRTEEKPSFSL